MMQMFFEDWFGLLRVLIVGCCAYAALVATLRISGKRTLSKMNAFDLVVTVALGSTLSTVLLTKEVPLTEGVQVIVLETDGTFSALSCAGRSDWPGTLKGTDVDPAGRGDAPRA